MVGVGMTVKNYTRDSGSPWICTATVLLVLLFLYVPVSGDDPIQVADESNGPVQDNGIVAGDPVSDNPVSPTRATAEPETTVVTETPVEGLPTGGQPEDEPLNGEAAVPPVTDQVPATAPQNDQPPVEQTILSGGDEEVLVQNETVPADPPVNNEVTDIAPSPANTITDQPGEPVITAGNNEGINTTTPLPQVTLQASVTYIPPGNTGNTVENLEPDQLNSTVQGIMEITGIDTVQQAVTVNTSAGSNSPGTDQLAFCTVNPPWAANLTDPPLNTTNLIPGIGGGDMWEINGTTGPGYYPLDMGGLDTLSLIGIWIHDVTGVVLDGLGNNLVGHEGGAREGSIGILINGDVSNVQVKNFSAIAGWHDGIVVQSGENITLGDNLNAWNNDNSGINVTDSSQVDIQGNIEVSHNSNYGIFIGNSSGASITGPITGHNNGAVGINVTNSSEVIISDGIELFNSNTGILITRSQDVQIVGDVNIHDNTLYGVVVSSSDNVSTGPGTSGYVVIPSNYIGLGIYNTSNTRINDTEISNNQDIGVISVLSSSILLQNATIEYNGDGPYEAGIRIENARGWHRIFGSSITHNSGDGIEVIDSNWTWVDNSTITSNGVSGIGLGKSDPAGGSNDCSVTNSSVRDNGLHGIASYDNERLLVNNTRIQENGGDGVYLYRAFQPYISNNYIRHNIGAGVNATSNSWENNFTANTITENRDGIILNTAGNSDISRNTISDSEWGIMLVNGYGSTVGYNNVSFTGQAAILVNQSDDNRIIGNKVNYSENGIVIILANGTIAEQNHMASDTSYGIICNSSTNTSILGNILSPYHTTIMVNQGNDTMITGNRISGSNQIMQIVSANRTLIGQNDIESFFRGIELIQTNNTAISGNTLHSYSYGLSLTGTDDTLIYNNNFRNVENVIISGATRSVWNITPLPGPNIVGGPSLGGNYYSTPGSTGWSQTNPDLDGNGFTDLPYTLAAGNTDEYPLSIAGEVPPPPGPGGSVPTSLTPPPDLFVYGARIVSENFPESVCAGASVPVSVTVMAEGDNTWTPGGVRLGAYNDASGLTGPAYVNVSGGTVVQPGQEYTFYFTFNAPSTPGTYTFQYRMQKSDGSWFGDTCTIVVTVVDCEGRMGITKGQQAGRDLIPGIHPARPPAQPVLFEGPTFDKMTREVSKDDTGDLYARFISPAPACMYFSPGLHQDAGKLR